MPIALSCHACGKQMNVKDDFAGKKIKCPSCQHHLQVPIKSPTAGSEKAVVQCDRCRKKLRIALHHLKKRIRCPSCQEAFVATQIEKQGRQPVGSSVAADPPPPPPPAPAPPRAAPSAEAVPRQVPHQVEVEVNQILSGTDDPATIYARASHLENSAVDMITFGQAADAIDAWHVAGELYSRLARRPDLTKPQFVQLSLNRCKTDICRAAAARQIGDFETSMSLYESAEQNLRSLSDMAFSLDEQNWALMSDWVTTTGATLMNKGTLLKEVGQIAEALGTWTVAEELLFENHVKRIGPEADPECTGKVINLWENKMMAALALGLGEIAAKSVENTMKTVTWWVANDQELPDEVGEAFGEIMGCYLCLEPPQRALVDAHLPIEVQQTIIDLMED